jgi:cytochrome c biogenesis protein CcdA
LAIFLAQSNLLLLLSSRRRRAVRASLAVTLLAIALVYVLVALLILTDGNIAIYHEELYFRVLAVIAIIDALGTVLLPVLAVFVRDGLVGHERITLNLPHESASLLAQWAAESGQTPEDIVSALLLLGREVESE